MPRRMLLRPALHVYPMKPYLNLLAALAVLIALVSCAGSDLPKLHSPAAGDIYLAQVARLVAAGDAAESRPADYGLLRVIRVESDRIIVVPSSESHESYVAASRMLRSHPDNLGWTSTNTIEIRRSRLAELYAVGTLRSVRRGEQ